MKPLVLLLICLGVFSSCTMVFAENETLEDEQVLTDLTNQANLLLVEQDYEGAVILLDKVLKINPNNVIAMTNKGAALAYIEKYDEAIAIFDAALILEPQNTSILHNKASTLSKTDEEKAMQVIDQILKINPKDTKALFILGISYMGEEKYQDAIPIFETILEIEPQNELAAVNLQNILSQTEHAPLDDSRYLAYVQAVIHDSDGRLIGVTESDLVTYLPYTVTDFEFERYPLLEIVTINGKNYEKKEVPAQFSPSIDKFLGTIKFISQKYDFDVYVFAALTDGFPITKGDVIDVTWTLLREVS